MVAALRVHDLERLLQGLQSGAIGVVARDVTQPSPLALEVLAARPYAYLDDAPIEERRTQAVMGRRWLDADSASDLGRLDPEAIARVRAEAWPEAGTADELHDALCWLGFLTEAEAAAGPGWIPLLEGLARDGRATKLAAPAGPLWVATERVGLLRALWPEAPLDPRVTLPAALAARDWSADEALVELLRGRLEGLGPLTEAALATPFGLPPDGVAAPLAALEAEGFAMRGRFTADAPAEEWCERRLLARIHRYTVKRLRAEIEPVAARDLLRFLLAWQRVAAESRMQGADAVAAVAAQLEGFEAPAGAWESELLSARIAEYEPAWLDDECLAGRLAWARLSPRAPRTGRERGPTPVRTTPIVLLPRRHLAAWAQLSVPPDEAAASQRARAVLDCIREQGASFFDELVEGSGLLRTQLEEALAELVALGLVSADSFAGLRALLVPSDRRKPLAGGRRRRRTAAFDMADAGRWALARRPRAGQADAAARAAAVEHVARSLLRRYGVVFWRLLEREAPWLPPWRDLLRVYRRLEARGEIRGGRFVAGFSGEQFALPEAIGPLREARRKPAAGEWVSLSGADPLNLVGILTPDARLPALTGNRLLYRDGLPVAVLEGGTVRFLATLPPAEQWTAQKALLRAAAPAETVELP